MAEIRLQNLTKHFGDVKAVQDLDLVAEHGSFLALLGPSGCGKTTTMNMISGLERPTRGEIYFDDVGDSHERIWDMLENYKEVVVALEETNESYISHRLNDILRVLTAISVIVLPLTLIASIWGMNVGVPGEGDEIDFFVIVGAMVALLVGMVVYFRRRGWL